MNVPFPVSLQGARTAAAVPVDQPADLSAALAALGLHAPRLVVVLVGVPAVGTVRFPGKRFGARRRWPLDAHHTHFVLVPGAAWGDEAPWIARVATELAGGSPGVTMLVNGGKVSYKDVACSLQVGRPVLTVAGSGRTADQLASAVSGGPADERAVRLAASGLVEVVNADDLAALQDALGARLQPPA